MTNKKIITTFAFQIKVLYQLFLSNGNEHSYIRRLNPNLCNDQFINCFTGIVYGRTAYFSFNRHLCIFSFHPQSENDHFSSRLFKFPLSPLCPDWPAWRTRQDAEQRSGTVSQLTLASGHDHILCGNADQKQRSIYGLPTFVHRTVCTISGGSTESPSDSLWKVLHQCWQSTFCFCVISLIQLPFKKSISIKWLI